MSGHSKWSKIKRKKAREDARKGKIFSKLTRAIIVATKEGGPDPEMNPSLAQAIDKAKQYNLPKENIERAIKKAVSGTDGENYERAIYEGYAVDGVAVLVEAMTDNRNRTAAEIRHIFSSHDGNLGESGCVEWMFKKQGRISILKNEVDEDELLMLALEAGAEDMKSDNGYFLVIAEPKNFAMVKEALESSNIKIDEAEITMHPTNTVRIDKKAAAKKIINLIDELEEHDDVQEVYSNFDIRDEILEEINKS